MKTITSPAMKRRFAFATLLLLSLAGSAGSAWAQQGQWRDLPPDERRQIRQQMREHWQQDRDIRREEGGRRWQDVPPEDRRRLREDMRDQRGGPGNREAWPERGRRRD